MSYHDIEDDTPILFAPREGRTMTLIDADVLRECREALEETAWADWGKLTHLQFNQMRMSADAALSRLPDEGPEPFERLEDGSLFIASDDADSMGVCVRRYGAVIELQHRFANGYIKPPGFSLLLGPNARAVAHAILALVSAPQGTETRDIVERFWEGTD